ncbi:hypothetical protein [Undibacterium fentianense]|uniref:Uncharacterized protein n=1 Tax=Undibacterium fentianense TaxID=2828728 RepID=A0A941E248_9BURK|nr:hypothetical protein [Undibacterium fentianense]MBR7799677.1 hypothetical protein [Undibacterium fentianense]
MKTNQRNVLIAVAVVLALLFGTYLSFDTSHVVIHGEEIGDIGGFAGFLLACVIGFFALFFALSVTGLVLAGVGLILVVVLGAVLGSFVLALLPLAIPFLILYGLYALITRNSRRNHA